MSQMLVINRVGVLGSGPHTPTQFFWEYPPKEKIGILGWIGVCESYNFVTSSICLPFRNVSLTMGFSRGR